MSEEKQVKINYLKRKIDQCVRSTGFDENFIAACEFHLRKVLLAYDPSEIKSREEYVNVLLSNIFMDKMDLFPVKRFKNKVNECTAWPIPLVPSEVFAENLIPVETRKFVFYQCLRVGDYLECRVISSQPSSPVYQLRVIHKYGITRMLDDLNIIMTMRKADIHQLPQVLKEFGITQLVRVVVTEKKKEGEETKVYVSVIDENRDVRSFKPVLGAIPDTQVPKYVLNPYHSDRPDSTFREYLTSNRGFFDPVLLNGIYEGFGISPRGVYSYFPVDESLVSMDANALLKESKRNDADQYLLKARESTSAPQNNLQSSAKSMELALRSNALGKCMSALAAINLAIKIYPKPDSKKDKVELSHYYEIRGSVHAAEVKPRMSLDACKDWVKASQLDRTNDSVKVELSREMTRLAMKCYKYKNYNSAAKWVSNALKLNDKNAAAHDLMEYLKKKHPEATYDWDEESIQALLEKHQAIGTELKKLSGEARIPTIVPYEAFESSTSSSPTSSTF